MEDLSVSIFFSANLETEFHGQSLNFFWFNMSIIFSQYRCSKFLGKWIQNDVLMVILSEYQTRK